MKNLTTLAALIIPLFAAAPLYAAGKPAPAQLPVTSAVYSTTAVSWQPSVPYVWAYLRVTGASDFVHEQDFAAGSSITFSPPRGAIADGTYTYELTLSSIYPGQLDGSRPGDGGQEAGAPPTPKPTVMSGTIKVVGGSIVQPVAGADRDPNSKYATALDQVIADDLIVQGSGCFGFDCVDGESFSFDTIRLKENNLRIKFEDTSLDPFPSTDWQLTANDSASGGANRFSIEDITAATIPFTVTGNAPSNSIFVNSSGRVGLKTSSPVLDLHLNTSNTPGVRLEQNSSGGFSPQTWDIAGNEANFFVRDVTGGSRLPFRIRPGAPTSSFDIAADGNVGMGTASPATALDVTRSTATNVALRLKNSLSSWEIKNNGDTGRMTYSDDPTGARVPFKFGVNAVNNLLRVGVANTSTVDVNGTLTVNGTFNNLSSREFKDILGLADGHSVLAQIASLPLFTWSYKNSNGERHFGPVAEDFYARFRLGTDEKHISPNDMAGVALAATKALNELISEKDAEISLLKGRLSKLESLLVGHLKPVKSSRKTLH